MAKSILIVDDSETIREAVSYTLENASYAVEKATDGQDALVRLEQGQYELIITSKPFGLSRSISLRLFFF